MLILEHAITERLHVLFLPFGRRFPFIKTNEKSDAYECVEAFSDCYEKQCYAIIRRRIVSKKRIEEIVMSLNIIDDTLFQKMAEDKDFCEELLSTVLEQNVIIEEVIPQNSIKNLQGRSVILDALCRLENGSRCNIEVQKANDDDHERRVRYNTSCVTANITDPGTKFEKVPNVIAIFISKFDMFQKGKTVYHVDRMVRETGEITDNGLQEIYVNTKIDDGSDIAKLMKIYREQREFDFEKFPKTSIRKMQFIGNEGGKRDMCEIVDNYAKEVAKEKNKEMVRKLFEKGVDFDIVCQCAEDFAIEELREIYSEMKN